jgi:peptidase E
MTRRILAMGGGGFTMSDRSPALDRLALELSDAAVPRVCFLPTASGDPREQTTRFLERFSPWPCEPTILSLFHLGRDRLDPAEHLAAQDVIYVGGGSLRNLLAIWREHGIDRVLIEAWRRGTVLAGLSAGAMCWFAGGVSKSGGAPEPARGLGLLDASLSVHLDSEPERLPVYLAAVGRGELPGGWAAEDGAALVFEGRRLARVVAARYGARVLAVRGDGQGGTNCRELRPEQLEPAATDTVGGTVEPAIEELRELRAARQRWE